MESTFDEVGLLIKIYSDGCINYYLKTIWACPEVESGTSRTLSENRATRPTGQIFFCIVLELQVQLLLLTEFSTSRPRNT